MRAWIKAHWLISSVLFGVGLALGYDEIIFAALAVAYWGDWLMNRGQA